MYYPKKRFRRWLFTAYILVIMFITTACSSEHISFRIYDLYRKNNKAVSVIEGHSVFLPEKELFAQINWNTASCEYYWDWWQESSLYVHLYADNVESTIYSTIRDNAIATLDNCKYQNNDIVLFSDETIMGIDYLLDDNSFNGCHDFFSVAVFGEDRNSIEIWICDFEDCGGPEDKNFLKFIKFYFNPDAAQDTSSIIP